jgi:hypothetical protein
MPRRGDPTGTQYKREHPKKSREYWRRSNAKRGSARWYQTCECGRRKSWGHRRCAVCAERDLRAEREAREAEIRAVYREVVGELGRAYGASRITAARLGVHETTVSRAIRGAR